MEKCLSICQRRMLKILNNMPQKGGTWGGARSGSNNPFFGHAHTKKARRAISVGHLSEKNVNWKGDKVGYIALHEWVTRRFKKTKLCQNCKERSPFDLANKSGKYKRDIRDWKWLCRRCHMLEDGRMKNLINYKP